MIGKKISTIVHSRVIDKYVGQERESNAVSLIGSTPASTDHEGMNVRHVRPVV